MIAKVTPQDIAGFQAYTIRQLDQKISPTCDIDHYKLLNVDEDAINSRQEHLDVMCFPALFPDGKFGQHYRREKKVSASEYAKSRLLNKDSRFRKDPQYVFYLLWQQELRQLSAGIYNLLKSGRRNQGMTVDRFPKFQRGQPLYCLHVGEGDQTVLVSPAEMHGQRVGYSNSLAFHCAKYESPEIIGYLKKVNNVPDNYPSGRLCIEDPISVSRKYSQKFHSFFQTVIVKGQVLGKVTHYFWKKEYQARGAPHYHIVLWIDDAPVIGVDENSEVVKWME